MSKKKIFYLITRSEPGGAQSHVLELLKGFKDKYDLYLGTGEKGFLMDVARELGVKCHYIPHLQREISLTADFKAQQEIRKLIREIDPDLLHAHSSKAGILGRLASLGKNHKVIFTAHGWPFTTGTPLTWKLPGILIEWLLARITDVIITVSEHDYKLAKKYHITARSSLVTVHNGISDIPNPLSHTHNEVVTIIMVARFSKQKNYACLVRAVPLLKGEIQVILVGDGPTLGNTKQLSNDLNAQNKILFTGNRMDVSEHLMQSDIFVLSSNWEGFPVSTLEAMRSGLPIVASDVGGINEQVIDGENGFLTAPENSALLAKKIQLLIDSESLRKQFGNKSRSMYLDHYTATNMLGRTTTIYEQLL